MAPTAALHSTGWDLIHGDHTHDDDDDDDDDCTALSAERGGGGLIDQVIFAFCAPCLHSCLLVGKRKKIDNSLVKEQEQKEVIL